MNSMESDLFGLALGIEEPVYIEEVIFEGEKGELHIRMNFRRGGKFSCSDCGQEALAVAETREKKWRHLNFFQYKCYIHLRTPQTKCPRCGERLWVPPWGRKQSGFTLLFEAFVMALAREMPVSRIGELVGEYDGRLWRIVGWHVGQAYQKKDFSAVKEVGMDETSCRKGHNYISVFADMDCGEVLFATPGKDESTIERFAQELPKHDATAQQISEVVMDMSPAFIAATAKHLPQASVTFDKFHVIQALNRAQDEVRRTEQKDNPLLKRSRYVWLKNPENLNARQKETLESLRGQNLKTAKVYQMKLTFQDIYRYVMDVESAQKAIAKWLSWAVRSRLDPIKAFAKMLKAHMEGVLRYFQTRLTSGAMEGINSRIQEIKRRARGFRNINNFISMIYLEASGLTLELPATTQK